MADTLDATEVTGDSIATGDTPSTVIPSEPSTPPEMLTKEQAEKLANEKHSTLDKRIGELEKAGKTATRAVQDAETRAQVAEEALANAERANEQKEYDGIKDNPDALSIFESKKALREAMTEFRKRETELKRKELENEETITEAKEFKVLQKATEIASKHKGVTASELVELTDGTPEKMEKMAARLSGTKPAVVQLEGKPFEPDSGAGTGGDGKYTNEQLEAMTEEQYAEYARKRDEKKK